MATTDLAKLVVRLEAQTAQYSAELEKANRKLSKFGKDTGVSLAQVATRFATLGVAAVTGLALLTKSSIDAADHLNDLKKATGVSVLELSRIGFAATQSGADLDDVSTGFRKLNLAIAEAAGKSTSDSAQAFRLLGISVQDASGQLKTADVVFKEVADKFKGYADGANKSEIANQLFGKSFQQLIPLLNEGSVSIEAMGDRAEKLHIAIGDDLAAAADEFNDRLGEMKAELVDGLGNQIAANVLPAFIELQKVWQEDSGRAETLTSLAKGIADVFKLLVTVGITVVSVFQQIFTAITAAQDAAALFAKGDVKGGLLAIAKGIVDVGVNVEKDVLKIQKIWDAGPLNPDSLKETNKAIDATSMAWWKLNEMTQGQGPLRLPDASPGAGKGPLLDAPSLTAAKEKEAAAAKAAEEAARKHEAALKKLAEQAENARTKLGDMALGLKEQVATFGLGDAAATEYRLTLGSLKDDVEKAGASGGKLRDAIIAQAKELERLQNNQAVADIDAQILSLTGHTKEAALATFDLANAQLKTSLSAQGDKAGLAALEHLRELTAAQEAFNETRVAQQKILDDLANEEERIQHAQDAGAKNELQALQELGEKRAEAAKALQGIAEQQAAIAAASDNPALKKNAEESARAVQHLEEQTHLLEDRIRTTLEDAGAEAFGEWLTGAKSAEDAIKSFIHSIEQEVANFVAKDLMRRLFGDMTSGTKSGAGGWLGQAASFIGGLFGGSRDSGGTGEPGKAYFIGRGAQPEMFIPRSHGTFVPAMAGGGGMQQVNHFNITAPGGRIDRRTEQQIANAAGRGVQMAQRRNG